MRWFSATPKLRPAWGAGRPIAAAMLIASALALELSSGCGTSLAVHEPVVARSPFHLIGYVAGWESQRDIPAEHLSAVNYAFAHVAPDSQVLLDAPSADDVIARLRALKTRNPRLKVLISIGGWGADGFSDAAASETSRERFARSAAELLLRTHADGIDIDWEYPGLPGPGIKYRDEDQRNFTLLLGAIRQRFDALAQEHAHSRYLITAALADREFVAHIELDQIHLYLDWINLMTYDFHNSLTKTTGHHSALVRSATSAPDERSVERAVRQFLAAGVPSAKLVVGVPFYGRAFAGVQADNKGLDQPYAKYAGEHPWPKLKSDYIDRNGFVRYWDDVAREPYLWNAATHTFVSYDDPQSLALKAAFVRSHHLGGIMYWEQSHDPDGELVDVLAKNLR